MEELSLTIGDVLRLNTDIGEIPAGLYAVAAVDYLVTISRLGEDEDGGMCMTCRTHRITFSEVALFVPMGLTIDGPL